MTQVDEKALVIDFPWAASDPDMNCWDKFYQYYLPHFVKPKENQPLFDKNIFHFLHIVVSSDVNRKKKVASGKTVDTMSSFYVVSDTVVVFDRAIYTQ
jgi:hypothetical protein